MQEHASQKGLSEVSGRGFLGLRSCLARAFGGEKGSRKVLNLDVLNRGSRFAAIRIAVGSQRFQIARFESQGQKPFELLLRLYYLSLLRSVSNPAIRFASDSQGPGDWGLNDINLA